MTKQMMYHSNYTRNVAGEHTGTARSYREAGENGLAMHGFGYGDYEWETVPTKGHPGIVHTTDEDGGPSNGGLIAVYVTRVGRGPYTTRLEVLAERVYWRPVSKLRETIERVHASGAQSDPNAPVEITLLRPDEPSDAKRDFGGTPIPARPDARTGIVQENTAPAATGNTEPDEADDAWGEELDLAAQAFAEHDATACDAEYGKTLPACEGGEVIPHVYRLFPVCGAYIATAYVERDAEGIPTVRVVPIGETDEPVPTVAEITAQAAELDPEQAAKFAVATRGLTEALWDIGLKPASDSGEIGFTPARGHSECTAADDRVRGAGLAHRDRGTAWNERVRRAV